MQPRESWRSVQYDLRPAKQAERRMLIDAFQSLATAGFPIRDYQYTGMGSIYFVDFIMFHRLLGMTRMLSVEVSPIPKRLEFNKPFDCVEVAIGPIGDQIPLLSRDRLHILWLDYDDVVRDYHLRDLSLACTQLPVGSIVMITIDVEPPGLPADGPAEWAHHFESEAGPYLPPPRQRSFAKTKLAALNARVIRNVINSAMIGRPEVEFLPLFSFLYKDGHQMLTIGGMLCSPSEKQRVMQSALASAPYARFELSQPPFEIAVPRLTRKERSFLDKKLPCHRRLRVTQFELDDQAVAQYAQVYRFLPAYGEILL